MRRTLLPAILFGVVAAISCSLGSLPATPTPLIPTPIVPTPAEPCFWTDAIGAGSPALENQVQQAFAAAAITGTVQTSSYGEDYSCDGSYHVMGLDMNIEVQVRDSQDLAGLAPLADRINGIIGQAMLVSKAPKKGRVLVKFVSAGNAAAACTWDFDQRRCQP